MDGLRDYFTKPFCSKNKVDKTLFLVFILINGLVFFNAFFHESRIGYDFKGHLDNIKILSEFRLPARHESTQFFTPPLSYLPAAFIHSIIGPTSLKALKFSQLVNVVYSIALAFYLLKICDLIHPNNTAFKTITLGLVGMLPVYYKTFSFVRPEPLLAFLTVLAVYKALNVFVYDGYGVMEGVKLGFVFGLLILTKQQAFSLILGILLFAVLLALKRGGKSRACFMAAGLSLVLAFIVGGWFYLHLYHEYGTVFAFNREPFPRFSFSNRPRECYFGLGLGEVFIDPVRTSFRHHMLPKFYSELWGDWECYFIVYGLDVRSNRFIGRGIVLEEMLGGGVVPPWLKTNRYEVNGYLGRVNLVSLLPTAVFFMGILSGMTGVRRFPWFICASCCLRYSTCGFSSCIRRAVLTALKRLTCCM
jgi:hypothetical protein